MDRPFPIYDNCVDFVDFFRNSLCFQYLTDELFLCCFWVVLIDFKRTSEIPVNHFVAKITKLFCM